MQTHPELYHRKVSNNIVDNVRMPNKAFFLSEENQNNCETAQKEKAGLMPTLVAAFKLFISNEKRTCVGTVLPTYLVMFLIKVKILDLMQNKLEHCDIGTRCRSLRQD